MALMLKAKALKLLLKLIFWLAWRKPILPRLDSFTARALFFFGALVCVLSVILIQLHYAVFIAAIGCIAGTTALLAASWLIIHHKED